MTPVFLFIFLLSLTAVTPGAADDRDKEDESLDASEIIAKANADAKTKLVYGDIVPNLNRNAASCTAKGCKWPKYGRYVIVPYYISRNYNEKERNLIIATMRTFHDSTCIRFVNWHWWYRSFLYFFSGSGCWSYVGRQPRGQYVSLKKNGCLYTSTIQHEILHALGFHHEHNRSDRDDYIAVIYDNIKSGYETQFYRADTNNLGTPYDYNSVMHYHKWAFANSGWPTMIAIDDSSRRLGGAKKMTALDIERVNKLYQC